MPITTSQNLWAVSGSTDVQRTDLWTVDFSAAIRYLASLPDVFFSGLSLNKKNLPTSDNLAQFPVSISFPPQVVSTREVIIGTVPRLMPSYFEMAGDVRMTLYQATSATNSIKTFVKSWTALVRTGRQGTATRTAYLLPTSYSKPVYKFNIPIQLAGGSASGETLESSAAYNLLGAWINSEQQGQLDRSASASAHTVTIALKIQEILPQ